MTFNRKDLMGLAALVTGLAMGSNLVAAQKATKAQTVENQKTYGQPFLTTNLPNELQNQVDISELSPPVQLESQVVRKQSLVRKLSSIHKK